MILSLLFFFGTPLNAQCNIEYRLEYSLFLTCLSYHRNRLFLYFLLDNRISIISLFFGVSIPNLVSKFGGGPISGAPRIWKREAPNRGLGVKPPVIGGREVWGRSPQLLTNFYGFYLKRTDFSTLFY